MAEEEITSAKHAARAQGNSFLKSIEGDLPSPVKFFGLTLSEGALPKAEGSVASEHCVNKTQCDCFVTTHNAVSHGAPKEVTQRWQEEVVHR